MTAIYPARKLFAADISQPGVAEGSRQRAQVPSLCPPGNFGSGYAGLDCCTEESFTFAKISTPRVWSIPAYLLL
ncbi:MAG: hypothetical protein ACP5MD_03985, partial [Verrucomicrobiia bacterium]